MHLHFYSFFLKCSFFYSYYVIDIQMAYPWKLYYNDSGAVDNIYIPRKTKGIEMQSLDLSSAKNNLL